MQNAIALNANNTFGHDFNQQIQNMSPSSSSAQKRRDPGRYDRIASVLLPTPTGEGWQQEIFEDPEDDIVDQDGGVGDHEDHRYMMPKKYDGLDTEENQTSESFPPPPPPRRVLGNK